MRMVVFPTPFLPIRTWMLVDGFDSTETLKLRFAADCRSLLGLMNEKSKSVSDANPRMIRWNCPRISDELMFLVRELTKTFWPSAKSKIEASKTTSLIADK